MVTTGGNALTRRKVTLGGVALAGNAALVACGGQREAPGGATLQPATLIWTSWATGGQELERVEEQRRGFAATAPQIAINIQNTPSGEEYYTKLKAQLAADTGPDVFRAASPRWEELAKSGALADITPRVGREPKGAPLQSIYPNILPSTKFRGRMYGVPFASTYMVLYVNKPLFDRLGVPLPPSGWATPGWTWDAMLQRLRAITKRPDSIGAPLPSIGNRLWAMLLSNNAPLFNEALTETTIARPEFYEGLQWIADLRHTHQVATTSAEDRDRNYAFTAGRIGLSMSITVASLGNTLQAINNAFEVDLYPVPIGPRATKPGTLNSLSLWVMNRNSRAADAAWTFLKYLGSPDGLDPELRRGFTAPTYPGLEDRFMKEVPQLNRKVALDAQKYAAPLLNPIGYDEIEARLREGITEVYEARKSARQAMTELRDAVNQVLKAANA